jgi:hypothetical protein
LFVEPNPFKIIEENEVEPILKIKSQYTSPAGIKASIPLNFSTNKKRKSLNV